MRYRPEVDGLRAVAVVPVILFHAGFSPFRGGFLGVDMFFVISGFLITTIIATELEAGTFSLLKFYDRRIRRIIPALFLMLIVCIPFAWLWMMPSQFRSLSAAMVSVVLFASNFFFFLKSGYFDEGSASNPLLHTWSLAVEEQYYVLFPLALLLMWKMRRSHVLPAVFVLGCVSLIISEVARRHFPTANFYLAPTRAWELLVGAFCALVLLRKTPVGNDLLSIAGLLMVAAGFILFDSRTPIPSVYALLPTVGVCLILLFGHQGTAAAWLLSCRPAVAIGLISYSAYLWHQPIFAFARIRSIEQPSPLLMAGLAAATLGLALLSWYFVEVPFRSRRDWIFQRRTVFKLAGSIGAFLICFGVVGYLADGIPQRLPKNVVASTLAEKDSGKYLQLCLNGPSLAEIDPMGSCHLGVAKPAEFLLWGDSFAAALADGIDRAALQAGRSGLLVGLNSCPPIIGVGGWWAQTAKHCSRLQSHMLEIIERLGVKTVILHAAWARLDDDDFVSAVNPKTHDAVAAFGEPFMKTLDALRRRNIHVVVIGSPPDPGYSVPNMIGKLTLFNAHDDVRPTRRAVDHSVRTATALFKEAVGSGLLDTVIDLTGNFCGPARCEVTRGATPLYFDGGHLTRTASLGLAPALSPAFGEKAK